MQQIFSRVQNEKKIKQLLSKYKQENHIHKDRKLNLNHINLFLTYHKV